VAFYNRPCHKEKSQEKAEEDDVETLTVTEIETQLASLWRTVMVLKGVDPIIEEDFSREELLEFVCTDRYLLTSTSLPKIVQDLAAGEPATLRSIALAMQERRLDDLLDERARKRGENAEESCRHCTRYHDRGHGVRHRAVRALADFRRYFGSGGIGCCAH
jgi:hypothetical protein